MKQSEDGDGVALPGIAPEEDAAPATQLECDGELFELRPDQRGGTHYRWVSGTNPDYGFSVSPTSDDLEQHQRNIRSFLSMINLNTGFIEKD